MIKRIPAADKRISSTVLNVNASIELKCRFYDCKSTHFFGSSVISKEGYFVNPDILSCQQRERIVRVVTDQR